MNTKQIESLGMKALKLHLKESLGLIDDDVLDLKINLC